MIKILIINRTSTQVQVLGKARFFAFFKFNRP